MMISLQEYKSYIHWISLFILSLISKLVSFWQSIINSYLVLPNNQKVCTVEVWGPKRFNYTKYEGETSYDLGHSDRLYLLLLDYLSSSNSHFYSISGNTNVQRHVSADNYYKHKEGASNPSLISAKKPIALGPQYDHPHRILYKGEWLTVERTQLPQVSRSDYSFEKIKFTAKRRNRALIYELLDKALKSGNKDNSKENTVQIHKQMVDPCTCCVDSWEEMGSPRTGRPLNSVVLAEGVKERLVDDLREFLKSKDWYDQREIPYSRGYLLFGPPGSGKSSVIKAIATELNLDICLLSFTTAKLNDFTLSRHINSAPERSLILIEDIDAAFKSREDEFADKTDQNLSFSGATCSSTVTFSGLLNALDGVLVGGADARIIFMTTNHCDRLDPALIRPGRIDMKVCIDYPTDSQIKRLYERYVAYDADGMEDDADDVEDNAEDFVTCVRSCCGDVNVTMAMVQGLLMMHRHRHQSMCKMEWYKEAKEYFKEQACSNQRNKQSTWGLYV